MNTRIDAVYARQSVDKKDSISIESQIEFCKYELKGGSCKEYTDKGYSGKNTDRPRFQELVRDIESGLIAKVVVYKLDRISRSIIDFANMMALFQKYNVEFVSSTEKFDTSTPMGRAMLNICIVFAQLERETIQKRVTDAFYSRCQKRFHMGGVTAYGYKSVPTVMEGIHTKMLVEDSVAADHVRLMFEMYADPQTSLGDIVRYFSELGVCCGRTELGRVTLSKLLRNPVYARADLDLYEFFKAQGASIANEAADFTGTNGCILYKGRNVTEKKDASIKDQILVLMPHEGIISSELWLACRRKLIANAKKDFGAGVERKVKNTWLAGKVKCGRCGAALVITGNPQYFRCRVHADQKTCQGAGTIRARDFEESIYGEMRRKMAEFQTLTGGNPMKANPKLTALHVELAGVESEIEKLIDTLIGANATLLNYANHKIEEMDERKRSLMKAIADMSSEAVSPEHIKRISGHLDNWDSISFEDRRLVVDGMISVLHATSENVKISWKI